MRIVLLPVLLLSLYLPAGNQVRAADLCGSLFVPEGYGLECVERADGVTVVQPVEGVFSSLSELTVRKLDEQSEHLAYTEPMEWLTGKSGFDVEGLKSRLHSLSDDPDNPVNNDMLSSAVDVAVEALNDLRATSLSSCKESAKPDENRYEIECTYELGPLSYFSWDRIVEVDGERYLIEATTMNDQRLGHFKAIANSFFQ